MNIGKLYQVKNLYWMIYPSKDVSKYFNCNVSYISPNSIFVFLEKDEKVIKILSTNGEVGWIYLSDFYKDDIEEINQ